VKNSSLFYLLFLIYSLPVLSNIESLWYLKKSVNDKKDKNSEENDDKNGGRNR